MLHMRPHNRFEDVERMYLVGGGTHPGSGLPVIYSSARITTDLLLDDLAVAGPKRRAPRATVATTGQETAAAV
jgi:phytoene desaturase